MNDRLKRLFYSILGNLVIGVGIAILKLSGLGVDPLSFMNTGISNMLKMRFGMTLTIMNFFLVTIVYIFYRKYIGMGTIVNMLLVGVSVDFSYDIIKFMNSNVFWINFILLILGINVMAIGIATYLEADLGASAYDAMPYVLNRILKKQYPYKYTRIVLDVICIIAGLILKSKIGIGTIILGFFTGPLITFYRNILGKLMFKPKNLTE